MPIYAYRCSTCGHAQDVLRKVSDPPLTVCPACGAATFTKQVTAAGFQLKGSGWYVTDFRDSKKPPSKSGDAPATADAPSAASATANGDAAAKTNGSGDAAKAAAPAAAAAPAPAPAPSAPAADKGKA
jgi:putative FmdB family regulatory protein